MEEINELRKFYHLKNVERTSPVGERKESPAEHSWSSLILADYMLTKFNLKLDRLKIYELLIYHDIAEIETGDIPIHHDEERKNKKETERKAMEKLMEDFPAFLKEKVNRLFLEFGERKTKEAKFAKAIDSFDALIHFLDHKASWKGWTEVMVRKYHGQAIIVFPELEEIFEKLVEFCKREDYFGQ